MITLDIFLSVWGLTWGDGMGRWRVVYSMFIMFVLVFHPIILLVSAISHQRTDVLSRFFFVLAQPVQYAIAMRYFSSQKSRRLYESTNLDFLSTKDFWRFLPSENTLLWTIFIMGIFFVVESVCVFATTSTMPGSDILEFNPAVQGVIWAIVPLSIMYGRPILLLNTHVFIFSFLQQVYKMDTLYQSISERINNNQKMSVSSVCFEIGDIRHTVSRMIDKLGDVYSFTTLFGAISVGLMLTWSEVDYQSISMLVLFSIMQVLFLIVIHLVGRTRESFISLMRNRRFLSNFILRRNDILGLTKDANVSLDVAQLSVNLSRTIERLQPILPGRQDGGYLQIEVEEVAGAVEAVEAVEYHKKDLNVRHHGHNHVQPQPQQRNTGIRSVDESIEVQTKIQTLIAGPPDTSSNGAVLTTEEIVRGIYESVAVTGSAVDWTILNTLIAEDWSSFGLFGIEFSNGAALQRAIMVTVILVGSGSLFGIFTNLY